MDDDFKGAVQAANQRSPKITDPRRAGSTDMSGRSIDADQDLIVDEIMDACPLLSNRLSRVEVYYDLLPLIKPEVYSTEQTEPLFLACRLDDRGVAMFATREAAETYVTTLGEPEKYCIAETVTLVGKSATEEMRRRGWL